MGVPLKLRNVLNVSGKYHFNIFMPKLVMISNFSQTRLQSATHAATQLVTGKKNWQQKASSFKNNIILENQVPL